MQANMATKTCRPHAIRRPKHKMPSVTAGTDKAECPPQFRQPVEPIGLPSEGYVRLPTVLRVFPVGRSSWWAGIKTGRYPQPRKLSERCTAWDVRDIRRLLAKIASAQI
jgi:prophage regulatory protein